jgi:hypothetical protein
MTRRATSCAGPAHGPLGAARLLPGPVGGPVLFGPARSPAERR